MTQLRLSECLKDQWRLGGCRYAFHGRSRFKYSFSASVFGAVHTMQGRRGGLNQLSDECRGATRPRLAVALGARALPPSHLRGVITTRRERTSIIQSNRSPFLEHAVCLRTLSPGVSSHTSWHMVAIGECLDLPVDPFDGVPPIGTRSARVRKSSHEHRCLSMLASIAFRWTATVSCALLCERVLSGFHFEAAWHMPFHLQC